MQSETEKVSLDPDRQERAKEYACITHRLFFIQLVLSTAILLVFLLSGLSESLRDLWALPRLANVAVYVLVLVLGYGAVLAPLSFYSGYVLPHRFGLSTQGLKSWLFDLLKAGVLSLTLGISAIVAVYWLLDEFTGIWWLLAAAFFLLLTVVLTALTPLLIIPLFFKLKPLEDSPLSDKLMDLTRRAGVRVKGISVMDLSAKTTAGNAMLAGLGKTRRIILGDTVLEKYSADEIGLIMAHELGHHKHNDISRLIGIQSAVILLGFYLANVVLRWAVPWLGLDGISDIAAFPVLVLTIGAFNLLVGPLTNAYSRRLETSADRYALTLAGDAGAFVNMMTKLANQNLSEATPSRWVEVMFYDHPPYWKRVENAWKGAA